MGYKADSAPKTARNDKSVLVPSEYHPTPSELAADEELHRQELSEQRKASRIIDAMERQVGDALDLGEMASRLRTFCPVSYRIGRLPEPTNAEPGSAEKLQILQDRVARGESTSHPNDAYKHPYERWHCPGTPRLAAGKESA